eukprot:6814391-Pyramimonas_sp.AAC.1
MQAPREVTVEGCPLNCEVGRKSRFLGASGEVRVAKCDNRVAKCDNRVAKCDNRAAESAGVMDVPNAGVGVARCGGVLRQM